MAVYLVEDKDGNKTIIETRTKAGAINHVSRNGYKATTLTTGELLKHIQAGMKVEAVDDDEVAEEPTNAA